MKKVTGFPLICVLAAFMLAACERNQGVHAGNDEYQPRDAPTRQVPNPPIKGELSEINLDHRAMVVRLENGMVQTFKFDSDTAIVGLVNSPGSLVGKEGSELAVQWKEENGTKVATAIEVTQVVTSKSKHPAKRHR
jgi:predicted small secreted protein